MKSLSPKGGLRTDSSPAIVLLLNLQLADALDLGLQVKQAHWNVKGPHFPDLHALFDQMTQSIGEWADEMAERAVALGGTARGTIQIIGRDTRLAPYPIELKMGDSHLVALSVALTSYGRTTRAAVKTAEKADDVGTADLFTGILRQLDQMRWKIDAQLYVENGTRKHRRFPLAGDRSISFPGKKAAEPARARRAGDRAK